MDFAERSRKRKAAAACVLGVPDSDVIGTFVASPVDARVRVGIAGVLAPVPGVIGVIGALLGSGSPSGQSFTVAISVSDVWLLRNGLRGPKAVTKRVPRSEVGPVRGPMEGVVAIGGGDYSVALGTVDEARRVLGATP